MVTGHPMTPGYTVGDLRATRATEMQCVGPSAHGNGLALINLVPGMGKITGRMRIISLGWQLI